MSSSGSGSTSDGLRFPLEERFLARVRINSNRFEDWKAIAQREIGSIIDNPKSWYHRPNDLKNTHRAVYEQDAIRGFAKQVDGTLQSKELLSLAHLELTLDDIQYALHTITTSEMRVIGAQLYGENFLDAAVLRVQEGQTAHDPFHFVGLKWLAFASPAQAIIQPRDYVFFEYSGTMQDNNGRKVLFVYQRSFPLQSDELHEPEKPLVRGEQSHMAFFRMEGGGVLYHALGVLDPGADVPAWVSTRYMTEFFDSIKQLVGLPSARAIVAAGMVKQPAPPKSSETNKICGGCHKKFSMLRTRLQCRCCGTSVCKHCVTDLTIFNEEAVGFDGGRGAGPVMKSEHFCLGCIHHAKSRRDVDHISATLTKTNLGVATTTTTTPTKQTTTESSSYAPTMPSTSSSYADHHHPYTTSKDGLRASIERQIGLQQNSFDHPGGSSVSSSVSSSNGTSSRSVPLMYRESSLASDDGAGGDFHSPYNTPPLHQTGNKNGKLFEQMNESIRQQEELLQVIQQERARIQARQGQAPPVAIQAPPPPPPPVTQTSMRAMPFVYHAPLDSPSSADQRDPDGDYESGERFQMLT